VTTLRSYGHTVKDDISRIGYIFDIGERIKDFPACSLFLPPATQIPYFFHPAKQGSTSSAQILQIFRKPLFCFVFSVNERKRGYA
jgi:hypothetical protein